jgi:hypothetical protein
MRHNAHVAAWWRRIVDQWVQRAMKTYAEYDTILADARGPWPLDVPPPQERRQRLEARAVPLRARYLAQMKVADRAGFAAHREEQEAAHA